ncbi:MAG: hypothetical protein E7374_03465 [Clostridiales bacterium]|nr:hypothetical protein [Clostridiales bacterium]
MDFERERESELNTSVDVETQSERKIKFEDLPNIEEMIKSEQTVQNETKFEGLTKVEPNVLSENRTFKKKEDQKKSFIKKRIKTISGVYIAITTLILVLVGVNIFTLVALNKEIDANKATMQRESVALEYEKTDIPSNASESFEISLNEPRDYSDDYQELTFLDKMTIFFRNLLG